MIGAALLGPECETLEAQLAEARRENHELRRQLSVAEPARAVGVRGPVNVERGARSQYAIAFGQDIEVEGHVLGDAVSIGGTVRIGETGEVDGNAVSLGGAVEVEPGGRLDGASMELGPSLTGSLPRTSLLPSARSLSQAVATLARRLIGMLFVGGAGMLVLGVFPRRVERVARALEDRPLQAAVVGTLSSAFLLVFSALFTLLTLGIGSPVALFVLALLGAAWLLGFVGLCQAVGDRLPLFNGAQGRWLAFLVGVAFVTLLSSLPWIGWMVGLSASLLGVGSALTSGFGGRGWGDGE